MVALLLMPSPSEWKIRPTLEVLQLDALLSFPTERGRRLSCRPNYLSSEGFNSGYFAIMGFMISNSMAPIDFPIMSLYSLNSSSVHND